MADITVLPRDKPLFENVTVNVLNISNIYPEQVTDRHLYHTGIIGVIVCGSLATASFVWVQNR